MPSPPRTKRVASDKSSVGDVTIVAIVVGLALSAAVGLIVALILRNKTASPSTSPSSQPTPSPSVSQTPEEPRFPAVRLPIVLSAQGGTCETPCSSSQQPLCTVGNYGTSMVINHKPVIQIPNGGPTDESPLMVMGKPVDLSTIASQGSTFQSTWSVAILYQTENSTNITTAFNIWDTTTSDWVAKNAPRFTRWVRQHQAKSGTRTLGIAIVASGDATSFVAHPDVQRWLASISPSDAGDWPPSTLHGKPFFAPKSGLIAFVDLVQSSLPVMLPTTPNCNASTSRSFPYLYFPQSS